MTRFYLKIVGVILLVMIAAIIVFSNVSKRLEKRLFKPQTVQQLHSLTETFRNELAELPPEDAKRALERIAGERDISIELVDWQDLKLQSTAPPSNGGSTHYIDLGGKPYLVALKTSDSLIARYVKESEVMQTVALCQVLLIIGLAGFFIVRPLVKKLRQQEQTIAKIADGDLNARVEVSSKDAIGRLGNRLNLMADHIQELLGRQKQLIQAVSHEMRTPTARIGFALEMLQDAKSEEERERRIHSLNEDVADMDALLDELLTFLRFDETASQLAKDPTDLIPIIFQVSDRVRRFREDLIIQAPEVATFTAAISPKYFPRVLENLLMNGMRHAKSRIEITVGMDGKVPWLAVADDGPGIAPSDAERIFEPFIRLDPSRDRSTGGTGLGLAIVKRIVARHQGSIVLGRSENLGGAHFLIRLPHSKEASN